MCDYETKYFDLKAIGFKGYKCPHRSVKKLEENGKKYCIFHSEREDKDVEKFYKGFKKLYEDGKHDFTGFVFPKGFDFWRLRKEMGELRFVDAVFLMAIFLCSVYFSGAEFTGEGGTDFREAKFTGEGATYFSGAKFTGEGGTYFRRARFTGEGGTDFGSAKFSCGFGTDFSGAKFSGEGGTYFRGAKFSGEGGTDFSGAEFSGEGGTSFSLAEFSGKGGTDFIGAKFLPNSKIVFFGQTFTETTIGYFGNLLIDEKADITFDGVNLNRCRFFRTDLRRINFSNVYWANRKYGANTYRGRLKVYDESFQEKGILFRKFQRVLFWLKDKFYKLRQKTIEEEDKKSVIKDIKRVLLEPLSWIITREPEPKERSHYDVYNLYNQLIKNYEENNRYHEAGDFFAGMMEMRRRMLNEKRRIRVLLWFYRLLSLYGERPSFAFGWLILLWFLFGLIFLHLGLVPNVEPINREEPVIIKNVLILDSYIKPSFKSDYLKALNVSLNNLTFGRVDADYRVFKTDYTFLFQGLEIILGAVLISLFILAMNRKFRRTQD